MKRICIYPYNSDCDAFLRHSDLLEKNYSICEIVSLKGWGFAGKVLSFNSVNYEVKCSLDELADEYDILFVPEFQAMQDIEDMIVEEIVENSHKAKMIMCATKLTESNIQKLIKNCSFKYLIETDICNRNEILPEISSIDENIEHINVPVIAVAGLWENTDKFETSLILREKLLNEGYKVSQVGTRNYCELFGFHSFPKFMLDGKISEIKKPILFNRFIKKIVEAENPDVIIIGVPGSIQTLNEKYTNRFGILPFIIFQSLIVDFLVICTFYECNSIDFLNKISNLCEYKFGCTVDAYHMSNLFIDLIETNEKEQVFTNRVPRDLVQKTLNDNYNESTVPILNVYENSNQDKLLELIYNKLSNDITIII